jgi:biotin carboxylase
VLVLQVGLRPGPWTCRSLAEAGYRVVGGHEDEGGGRSGRSRWCPKPLRYPPPRLDADGFLQAVEDICRREGIAAVLPLSETTLHLLVERLPSPGGARLVGPSLEQYRALCEKTGLVATAAGAGVATPRSVFVREPDAPVAWPPLPSVIKPLASTTIAGPRVAHIRPVVASSEEERARAVVRLAEEAGGALVQELVRGQSWRVDVVRAGGATETLAWRTFHRHPHPTGVTVMTETVHPTPPVLYEAVARLLEAAGYEGQGEVEVLERDGEFVVHDVNLRLAYALGGSIRAGFDLPRLAVGIALGTGGAEPPRFTRPVTYAWLVGVLRELPHAARAHDGGLPAMRLAAGLARALVSRSAVLDPLEPFDPPRYADLVAAVLRPSRAESASA